MTRANTDQVGTFPTNGGLPIGEEQVGDTVVDNHDAPRTSVVC